MSRPPGSVRHRVTPASSGASDEHTTVVVPDVALLVRRHVVGPVLGWAAALTGVWAGCEVTGHVPGAPLGAAVALCAAAGAALSLRSGARTVATVLVQDNTARAAEAAAEDERRQEAHEFWQRASTSLEDAVRVLRTSQETLTSAHQDSLSLSAAQDRDFRNVTGAWLDHYRRFVDDIVDSIRVLLADVQQGQVPDRPAFPALPTRPPGMFDELDRELLLLGHVVRNAVIQAAAANTGTAEAELGVFAGIAKRLRSRADRVLVELDGLERSTEDPDALQSLLRVDHKVVQIRRDVEALQVLAGDRLRQSGGPAEVSTILRQATAEIEDYGRVRIETVAPVQVAAYARSGLIHILAALLENACRFSRDQVCLASALDASGLSITVEDKGLHMPAEDLRVVNALLADPDPVVVRTRLVEGRIGLLVTAKLARQFRLKIVLQPADERGTRVVITVPPNLLVHPAEQPSTVPESPQPAVTPRDVPARPDPASAATALASVSPLPASELRRSLPRRSAVAGGNRSQDASLDGEHRPGLPRRQRAPVESAPAQRPQHSDHSAVATPGLAGAFLQGTSHADTDSPSATQTTLP